jgi:ATP diphosphatase
MKPSKDIHDLLAIMVRLRTPDCGCPWDLTQDFASIAPYTIEEAYEVADAIERGDFEDLRDELGDLLLQVVFHSQMAAEAGEFTFGDVVQAIGAKMVRRHPHVFGAAEATNAAAVRESWEAIKAEEKAERSRRRGANGANGEADAPESILKKVPLALPALTRAVRLQERAGTVGFDWDDARIVLEKIREEVTELESELTRVDPDEERLEEEFGDILFALANLGRHLEIDPESALKRANTKFAQRFRHIETELHRNGRDLKDASLEEMETLWTEAKGAERKSA